MKKTLTTELVLTILFVLLGVFGFYFLSGVVKIWVLPVLIAVILLGYLVRWQFVLAASVLMPMVTALLTLNNGFSWASVIIEAVTLAGIGLLVCFSYQFWKWEIHPALVFGVVFGNLLGGVAAWILNALFAMGTFNNLLSYTLSSLVNEIQGLAVIFAFIPLLVRFVFQNMFKTAKRK